MRRSARLRRGIVRARAVAVLGALALAGCGSSGGTGPSGSGSLTVTITAPPGVTPRVAVDGPAGYHQSLTATQTLGGLTTGSYFVTAETPARQPNPIVATVYDATVSRPAVALIAGANPTVDVSYAARPGSGALWVANTQGATTVVAYTAAQLATTTSAAPATTLVTGDGANPGMFGAAFDVNGNLWVTSNGGNSVVEFTASQLGASGSPTPTVTLSATGGSLNGPLGLAFDAFGNLWVANGSGSTIVEFATSQLVGSGAPVPTVTLSATGGSLNSPQGLAFDAGGNLWVANGSGSTIVEFATSQLVGSGGPMPNVTLSATGGSLSNPESLAFDASGNLWVANFSNTVVEFAASQLATSGGPIPNVTLSGTNGALGLPSGLAFDASGNLWVSNTGNPVLSLPATLVEIAASQLVSSGAPVPNVTISGSSLPGGAMAIAFDPPAANLPLSRGPFDF